VCISFAKTLVGSRKDSHGGPSTIRNRAGTYTTPGDVTDTGGGHDRPEAVGSRTCGEGACKSLHAGHHPSAGAPHGRRWLMVAGPPFSTSTYRTISAVAEDASRASVGHAMIQRPSPQSRSVDSETRSTTWEQAERPPRFSRTCSRTSRRRSTDGRFMNVDSVSHSNRAPGRGRHRWKVSRTWSSIATSVDASGSSRSWKAASATKNGWQCGVTHWTQRSTSRSSTLMPQQTATR